MTDTFDWFGLHWCYFIPQSLFGHLNQVCEIYTELLFSVFTAWWWLTNLSSWQCCWILLMQALLVYFSASGVTLAFNSFNSSASIFSTAVVDSFGDGVVCWHNCFLTTDAHVICVTRFCCQDHFGTDMVGVFRDGVVCRHMTETAISWDDLCCLDCFCMINS